MKEPKEQKYDNTYDAAYYDGAALTVTIKVSDLAVPYLINRDNFEYAVTSVLQPLIHAIMSSSGEHGEPTDYDKAGVSITTSWAPLTEKDHKKFEKARKGLEPWR